MVIQEMVSLGKSTVNLGNLPCQWMIMTNKPHAYSLHAKTSEENIHATRYLQEKPDVVANPNVLLHFLSLPLPSCSKNPSMQHSPRMLKETLSVQEYGRERERIEESSTKAYQKLTNWSSEAFLWMRPLFSSFHIIFLQFPPHRQPATFHLPFLLISIIFINKCAKISFFLSKALAIAFANFLSHNKPN